MKTKIILGLLFAFGMFSCTKDFVDINKNPNAVTSEEASAKYFLTNPEYNLYAPNRYPYWRAQMIHADRYAGQFLFGHHKSWWSDELGYSYSASYTDATWGWMDGYFSGLDNFMKLTDTGGDFENELMHAVGLIIKGLYYQMFTDTFGEVPYSEAGILEIPLPKFDKQPDIYKGIIADLEAAIATIGDNTTTGNGVNDMGVNDLYFHGDLQKWKKMANTLKLRIAIRAHGATGDDFSDAAITSALSANLFLETPDENCSLEKDNEISQWGSSCYGDVWDCCGWGGGSAWTVSKVLIDYLLKSNDPRLSKYVAPNVGGSMTFYRPDQNDNPEGYANFGKRASFIAHAVNEALDLQGVDTSGVFTDYTDSVTINVPGGYYVGQPVRLNGKIKGMVRTEYFSEPAAYIIQKKNEGKPIAPEIVMTSGEAFFLRAQAVLDGFSDPSGKTAQQLYEDGITQAMTFWGVDGGDITTYLTSGDPLTTVSAENIAVQRWINDYTDGFEAWAVVRKTGFPSVLSQGVSDIDIYGLGDINGDYPTRMRYGNQAASNNGDNLAAAIADQGPDVQNTKLWFEK